MENEEIIEVTLIRYNLSFKAGEEFLDSPLLKKSTVTKIWEEERNGDMANVPIIIIELSDGSRISADRSEFLVHSRIRQ